MYAVMYYVVDRSSMYGAPTLVSNPDPEQGSGDTQ